MRPERSITVLTSRSRSSGLPACAATAKALPGNLALMRSASASRSACLRLESTTPAPCSASALAIALPMPRLAPVTRAILPVKSRRDPAIMTVTISRH